MSRRVKTPTEPQPAGPRESQNAATLTEVARRARVSAATVSRVLNQPRTVKPATRQVVEQAIQELKFHPNLHARMLAAGTSQTLGLIVSNLENPFFLDIFRAMEDEAHRHDFELMVQNTDYDRVRLVAAVHQLLQYRVAGVAIIVSEMEPALLAELTDSRIPAAIYDVGQPGEHITSIKVNYQLGVRKAVEYLFELGHRDMAFVGHHPGLKPLQGRREAFLEIMQNYRGRIRYATATGPDSPAGGQQAVREILTGGFRPTAILCANDFMALGALTELRGLGLEVPAQVSLVGFDNIKLAQHTWPPLASLDIPREAIGRVALQAILPRGQGKHTGREWLLEPKLIVRESIAAPPGAVRHTAQTNA